MVTVFMYHTPVRAAPFNELDVSLQMMSTRLSEPGFSSGCRERKTLATFLGCVMKVRRHYDADCPVVPWTPLWIDATSVTHSLAATVPDGSYSNIEGVLSVRSMTNHHFLS